MLGQIPHIKQREVLWDKSKNKVISCGRRSGKTQMIAGEIIRGAHYGEFHKQFVVTPSYRQSKIVFVKILELINQARARTSFDFNIFYKESPSPVITFPNGCFVEFGSADNPKTLRGEADDRQFWDEAAFLKEDSLLAIKPRGFDTGAPVWQTSTPWGTNQFKEKYEWGAKGVKSYGSFHYNYKDNPYLSPAGVADIEQEILEYGEDHPYVQSEIYGHFIDDMDSYFKTELIKSAIEEYPMIEVTYK